MDANCYDYSCRQALDYQSTWRAIGVVIIGFLVQAIVLIILLRIFGPT